MRRPRCGTRRSRSAGGPASGPGCRSPAASSPGRAARRRSADGRGAGAGVHEAAELWDLTPPDPPAFSARPCSSAVGSTTGRRPRGQWLRPCAARPPGLQPAALQPRPAAPGTRPAGRCRRRRARARATPGGADDRQPGRVRLAVRCSRERSPAPIPRRRGHRGARTRASVRRASGGCGRAPGVALVSRGEGKTGTCRDAGRCSRARRRASSAPGRRWSSAPRFARQSLNREAREVLRDGLALAERCGADALAARASDELATAGAQPLARCPARPGTR